MNIFRRTKSQKALDMKK